MISGRDTFNLVDPTTLQGNTEEAHLDKPDDVVQKHDITPQLKADGARIHEQQTVDLSSRAVTGLKTPSKPYTETSKSYNMCRMDNSPRSDYCATHANLPGVKPETVRIGNQELITLDTCDPALKADGEAVEAYNFSFLADFLSKNNEIKYIVDIGCGNAKISLLMQDYLNELNFKVTVIPVDVSNYYARHFDGLGALPINIIPAQEIVGATPATTMFTAIHSYTDEGIAATRLIEEIVAGKTDYYLTTLLKNNPGCFVLATEDSRASSPHHYIPPEMVYSKHYYAYANSFFREALETEPVRQRHQRQRQAEAAKINAGNSDLCRLNQLLAALLKDRKSYLDCISAITKNKQKNFPKESEEFWPDKIFQSYLRNQTCSNRITSYLETRIAIVRKRIEMRCWHVYRHGVSAPELPAKRLIRPIFPI